MSKNSKFIYCPKCKSSEIYGTRMKKEYFTVNQEEVDFFNSDTAKKITYHCHKCEHTFTSKKKPPFF